MRIAWSPARRSAGCQNWEGQLRSSIGKMNSPGVRRRCAFSSVIRVAGRSTQRVPARVLGAVSSPAVVETFLMSNKTKEGNHVFPRWLVPDEEGRQGVLGDDRRRPNLESQFL